MKRGLIVFLVATILVTAIFFTQNVRAESVLDSSSMPIVSKYDTYVVYKANNGKYRVLIGLNLSDNKIQGEILNNADSELYLLHHGTVDCDSIDEVKKYLVNGFNHDSSAYGAVISDISSIISSSHDVYFSDSLVFYQSPLTESSRALTVGKMNPQQIVTATTKQMVYLVPLLISSLVVFLAFRKGLALLFRVLKRG